MVFSLAFHFVHDGAQAEEVAQEVFLELFRVLPTLESGAHATNWLRRVTTHRCIDHLRREKQQPRIALEDVAEPACLPQAETIGGDTFLMERLRKLVSTLPEKAREVVILRYQEDLTPSEISAVLGMPVNSVKSHLHRSLTVLKEKLERLRVEL